MPTAPIPSDHTNVNVTKVSLVTALNVTIVTNVPSTEPHSHFQVQSQEATSPIPTTMSITAVPQLHARMHTQTILVNVTMDTTVMAQTVLMVTNVGILPKLSPLRVLLTHTTVTITVPMMQHAPTLMLALNVLVTTDILVTVSIVPISTSATSTMAMVSSTTATSMLLVITFLVDSTVPVTRAGLLAPTTVLIAKMLTNVSNSMLTELL